MHNWRYIGAILAALIALGCSSRGSDDDTSKDLSVSADSTQDQTGEKTQAPATGPTLVPSDMKLDLKVTDKQCFGSAGCSLEWRISVTVEKAWKLEEDADYEVTYEVSGVEDGPSVSTFSLRGDGTYTVDTGFGQTSSKSTKIKAKVVAVDKVGL